MYKGQNKFLCKRLLEYFMIEVCSQKKINAKLFHLTKYNIQVFFKSRIITKVLLHHNTFLCKFLCRPSESEHHAFLQ